MPKYFCVSVAIIILLSCGSNSQNDVSVKDKLDADMSAGSVPLLFANALPVDSSAWVIYPLVFERRTEDGGSLSSYKSYRGETTSYWNLVFYNVETGVRRLVTNDKRLLIYTINTGSSLYSSSSNIGHSEENIHIFNNYIFYTVVANDRNADGLLNEKDPNYLFVSGKDGSGFRQLSPDNYNITTWQVVKGTSKIILQGQLDDNKDNIFNYQDKTAPLIADVTQTGMAKEVFDKNDSDTIKNTLLRIWKGPKK